MASHVSLATTWGRGKGPSSPLKGREGPSPRCIPTGVYAPRGPDQLCAAAASRLPPHSVPSVLLPPAGGWTEGGRPYAPSVRRGIRAPGGTAPPLTGTAPEGAAGAGEPRPPFFFPCESTRSDRGVRGRIRLWRRGGTWRPKSAHLLFLFSSSGPVAQRVWVVPTGPSPTGLSPTSYGGPWALGLWAHWSPPGSPRVRMAPRARA